ncbi:MAG TPA: oligosaccharide flippase family protein [Steroidobacteraceae bacterium]|nr:oligosaccharide flippase family protein [Steroidobacteraceae bacterium]
MIWMSVSVLFSKATLFIMQIVLGFILDARDYSIFAVASVALTFVAGLQNAGASKMLIQKQAQYQDLVKDYTHFALYMGLIGAGVLVVLGQLFGQFYRNPELFYVIGLSAISVPFTSLISIQFARLSIDLRFRELCMIDFFVAAVNVAVVLFAALLGARYYSIGLGLVASTLLRYALNRRITPTLPASFSLSIRGFLAIFAQVKWLIVTAFLTGLAQQGDYFVLGRVISAESLGYYYFGFQLTANVGQLLAQGVGSTLFPIFTAMKGDLQALKRAFLRATSVIHFACSALCIGVVGFAPCLIHMVWRGKWDMATVTAIAIAFTLPMRMLSPMGGVTLDSFGKWRLRTALLLLDSGTMMAAALIGAHFDDLRGASIAVALQRLLSGLVDFSFAVRTLGGQAGDVVWFGCRSFIPFWLPAGALICLQYLLPPSGSAVQVALDSALRTTAAMAFFAAIAYAVDRQVIQEVSALLRRILFSRTQLVQV